MDELIDRDLLDCRHDRVIFGQARPIRTGTAALTGGLGRPDEGQPHPPRAKPTEPSPRRSTIAMEGCPGPGFTSLTNGPLPGCAGRPTYSDCFSE